MSGEDWVTAATDDDSLVAELLLRLRQPSPPPPPCDRPPHALHVDWIVRQRRSKPVPRHAELEKKKQPTRASPTTPLSWSGVTSASCGGTEGFEESSPPAKTFVGARSEKCGKSSEAGRRKTKRTTRKKTLAELKEEETSLVKERRSLKSALVSLRLDVEKQRAINERLKRLKSHRNSESATSVSDQHPPLSTENRSMITEVNHCGKINATKQYPFPSKASLKRHTVETFGIASLLPDLNLPSGEDPSAEFLQETR